MFSLGVFLFSTIRNYVGDLFGFLFGEILGISPTDLLALSVLAGIVLVVVVVLWKELLYSTFDPLGAAASGLPVVALDYLFLALIAMTIVVSLQAVGIILVVAMLVTPAATAQLLTLRFGRLMAIAVVIGVASPVVGLYLSYWLNTASGATIVLVETAVFLVALLLGPRTGIFRARPATVERRRMTEPPGTATAAPRPTARGRWAARRPIATSSSSASACCSARCSSRSCPTSSPAQTGSSRTGRTAGSRSS